MAELAAMSYYANLYEVRFPTEKADPGFREAIPEDVVPVIAPNVGEAIAAARESLKRGEWRNAVACQLVREGVLVR